MTEFMRGHRYGCDRRAVGNPGRKIQGLIAWIVVICELSCCALHLNTVEIPGGDQALSSHMTGQTTAGADLAPFAVCMPYIPGCESHQDERWDHKDEIHGIKEKR